MNNRIDWFIGSVLGILHSFLVNHVYKIVPEPYMDEIFHTDQARRFCALNFTWNPKITTPPALYLLSLPFFCGYERYTNSALIPFAFVGCIKFRQLFQKPVSKLNSRYLEFILSSLIVLLLPVLFHSSLLYYTDLLSLTTLLWAVSLQPSPLLVFSTRTYQCPSYVIRKPVKLLILCLIFTCCVYFFTLEHPYLLADNRHFTFYVWRRWFLRHPYCKYVTIVIYIIALQLFRQMIEHIPRVLSLLYILGTAAVLVPAYLLEPRYFIVPYIFWRLSYPERRILILIIELIYELFINVVVLYMFLYRPFEWSHEPDDVNTNERIIYLSFKIYIYF
ncbi:putative Dol-P-Glc:Glc(2)Man(9)GlcNAc(2)-PP-Dol alpha-1,2-glucosyltransferase [Dirofilaria immitis]